VRDGLRAVKNTIEDRFGSRVRPSVRPPSSANPRVRARVRVRACVRMLPSVRAYGWLGLCRCVLPGAGAFEIAAARMLKEHTKAMTGRAKMVRERPSCWLP
jgi:chaperonin GroEL (HSP60 family)